jgi:hypothetical protein
MNRDSPDAPGRQSMPSGTVKFFSVAELMTAQSWWIGSQTPRENVDPLRRLILPSAK